MAHKFTFNNKDINGLNKLVLEVIRKYVTEHPNINYEELKDIFPDNLQGSLGVIKNKEEINTMNLKDSERRFFLNDEDTINLINQNIYVSRGWGDDWIDSKSGQKKEGNKRKFLKYIRNELNYNFIEIDSGSAEEKNEIPIYQKIFSTFKSEGSQILTREQILNKVIDKYPNTNRISIIPSDYCINLKNKGSSKYELFEHVENGKYKVLNFVGVEKMNIKNIILYGAPGVGKTHNYKKLISLIEEGKSQKDIFDTIQKNELYNDENEKYLDVKNEKRVEFITFHQSFGYEDFIEGFRPNEEGNIQLEGGIFKSISKNALKNISNSNKSVDDIKTELNNENLVTQFIKDITYDEKRIYITKNVFISDIDEKNFYYTSDSRGVKNASLPINDVIICLTDELSSLKEISDNINLSGTSRQRPTYVKELCKKIQEYKLKNQLELEIIDESPVLNKISIVKNFYLVIDEINRGNISKIFGELITLIEESKRDNYEVTLPYSKEKFKVPSNLYIIGTMNTTDKSIALIDVALRRRFTFIKMTANEELVLANFRETFIKLNEQIEKDLGEEYQIGHSYFMNIEESDLDFVKEYKIKPLLEEYYYGDEKLKDVLKIIDLEN